MTVEIKITDIDMGWDKIVGALSSLDGAEVDGGLLDEEQAMIGARHEMGWRDVKPRPWLSIAADQGEQKIAAASKAAVMKISKGADTKASLEPVGELLADLGRDVIANRKVGGPQLKDSTVYNKGHSEKLIDKGTMLYAIDHEVRVK